MDADLVNLLNPGRRVELKVGDRTIVAVVRMPNSRQLADFFRTGFGNLAALVSGVAVDPKSTSISGLAFIANAAPVALTSVLALVRDTTTLEPAIAFDELPHHLLPPILSAWFSLNFGEPERVGPWADFLEPIVSSVAGKQVDLKAFFARVTQKQAVPVGVK